MPLSQQRLKELVTYDAATGGLYWRISPNGRAKVGARIGSPDPKRGYRNCWVDGEQHREHRLVFLYLHGRFPVGVTDHEHGVEAGNTVENLRDVTPLENGRNMRRSVRNKSGVVGVYRSSKTQRWCADIRVNDRTVYLGSFDTVAEAAAARQRAVAAYGFHPNHGMRPPLAP